MGELGKQLGNLKRQARREGLMLVGLKILTAAEAWDYLPTQKAIIDSIDTVTYWLNGAFYQAFKYGKLSPEAQAFVARKFRTLARNLDKKADELEGKE
jgi:hypothetical protein